MKLIANMRMYSVNPTVTTLWRDLTEWVVNESGIPLKYLDFPPPKPISELWNRADMGLVLMCGWPFWRSTPRPQVVAAPVVDDDYTQNQPVYWTELVTRADAPARSLEETFGGKIAWTIDESHSGCNAPRYSLLPHYKTKGTPLYSASFGPVVTPRGAIDAVLSGDADIAPVDSYFHLLLQRHEPETLAKLKIVARTKKAPVPLFVAGHDVDPSVVSALQSTLLLAETNVTAGPILQQLAIQKFVVPDLDSYATAEKWHDAALAHGYKRPS